MRPRASPLVLALLALLGLLGLATPAHADRAQALMYFRAGEKAYKAQNFEAAATNFKMAFDELPLPEIAFSAAQAFRRAYRVQAKPAHVQRAVELYRFYLDKVKTGGRVGDAADSLGEMERELDKLGAAMRVPVVVEEHTRLGITVSLGGERGGDAMREIEDAAMGEPSIPITTTIDGKPVKPDTLTEIAPGDHVIGASAPGYAPVERRAPAVRGDSRMIPIELVPLPAHVVITTERGAQISIDGRAASRGAATELAAGRHVLTIVRAGRRPFAGEFVVTRGQALTLDQPLESTLRRRAVPWVAGTAGVLAAITAATAIGAIYEDGRASDQLAVLRTGNQELAALRDYERIRDRRDRLVTATWAAGAAAVGVGVVAGLLYYFDTPSTEGLRVTPIASGGVSGAGLTGQF